MAKGLALGLPGTQLGLKRNTPAAHEACGGAASALAPRAVSLTVAALRQLHGALKAVQFQEGGDELGDGFHITGTGPSPPPHSHPGCHLAGPPLSVGARDSHRATTTDQSFSCWLTSSLGDKEHPVDPSLPRKALLCPVRSRTRPDGFLENQPEGGPSVAGLCAPANHTQTLGEPGPAHCIPTLTRTDMQEGETRLPSHPSQNPKCCSTGAKHLQPSPLPLVGDWGVWQELWQKKVSIVADVLQMREQRSESSSSRGPSRDAGWGTEHPCSCWAYLPVLQVLHSHKQAAGDVEELPPQTIWGQTRDTTRQSGLCPTQHSSDAEDMGGMAESGAHPEAALGKHTFLRSIVCQESARDLTGKSSGCEGQAFLEEYTCRG
ncbi:hypothetical protein MC885_014952, partial [Smutsia gigantea]